MAKRSFGGSPASLLIGALLVSIPGSSMAADRERPSTVVPTPEPSPTKEDLAYIHSLRLPGYQVPECRNVTELAKVKRLWLWDAKVDDAGLVHLRGLTRLEDLSVIGCPITDFGLIHLEGLTRLETLCLSSKGITDAGLVHLKGMTRMKDLSLSGKIRGPGLVHLKGMTKLEELDLSCSEVNDDGLAHLAGMVRLRKLDLGGFGNITDAGLAHLVGLKRLESLDLFNQHGVTDAGLAHLRGMVHLRELELSGTSVKGPGLKHLRDLKSLKKLRLGGAITDESMVHVAKLSGLEDLDMMNAEQITETGLDHLAKLSALKKLTIHINAVGPRFAEQLQKFPDLKVVRVEGRRLRDSQMAELHRLLPDVEFQRQDLATGLLIKVFMVYDIYQSIVSPE